jgi:small-conductance mechanosensitive channel
MSDHRAIYEEADRRWTQYLMLQLAVVLGYIIIFIPFINYLYLVCLLIASIVLTIVIMRFIKQCG